MKERPWRLQRHQNIETQKVNCQTHAICIHKLINKRHFVCESEHSSQNINSGCELKNLGQFHRFLTDNDLFIYTLLFTNNY